MLTSATLQLIALVTMLIDHVGAYLLNDNIYMRLIGRIAFPLFCFMLTEGFMHTKGKRLRYFGRLIMFAFISQLAFDLLHYVGHGGQLNNLWETITVNKTLGYTPYLNVMFTLATGFAAMALIEYGGWATICMPIILIFAEYLHMDYGIFGVLLVIGFYLSSKWFPQKQQQVQRWMGYIITLFSVTAMHVSIKNNPRQMFALVAIIPILLYNGKLGKRLPKWFSYIFYPAHMLVIAIIAFLTNTA